jgi:protein-disulfide isomerase
MRTIRSAPVRLAICFNIIALSYAAAAGCPTDLTAKQKARLVNYVSERYHVPAKAKLRIEESQQVRDTCYRKLVFRGDGALGPYRLTLYASPDLRFLSNDIFDSLLDPVRESQENAKLAMGKLLEGEYAARGPSDAAVTLVVFSDFQCPFCQKMAALFAEEPLLKSGDQVRLVFRHMPLSIHDWAQPAAEAAACAQFQNAGAFWAFHDKYFANQPSITAANIKAKTDEFAATIPGLDLKQFKTCMDRQMSLGAVIRDRDLGTRVGITGTPTLFLNGERLNGIRSAAELHSALASAVERTKPTNRASLGGQ